MKILIAEDNSLSRTLLKAILQLSVGWEVEVAEDGLAAWRALENGCDAQVVVADTYMPGLTGVQLVRRMRENEKFRDTPFILCSSIWHRASIIEAPSWKLSFFLLKPYRVDEILAALRKVERDLPPPPKPEAKIGIKPEPLVEVPEPEEVPIIKVVPFAEDKRQEKWTTPKQVMFPNPELADVPPGREAASPLLEEARKPEPESPFPKTPVVAPLMEKIEREISVIPPVEEKRGESSEETELLALLQQQAEVIPPLEKEPAWEESLETIGRPNLTPIKPAETPLVMAPFLGRPTPVESPVTELSPAAERIAENLPPTESAAPEAVPLHEPIGKEKAEPEVNVLDTLSQAIDNFTAQLEAITQETLTENPAMTTLEAPTEVNLENHLRPLDMEKIQNLIVTGNSHGYELNSWQAIRLALRLTDPAVVSPVDYYNILMEDYQVDNEAVTEAVLETSTEIG